MTMTNESEAMEVAEAAYSAGNLTTCDGYYEFDLDAAARVIATELEAKDTRIAELEGALEQIIKQDWWSAVDERDEIDGRCAEIARAIITKGNTHD